jgi:hypothetical protein
VTVVYNLPGTEENLENPWSGQLVFGLRFELQNCQYCKLVEISLRKQSLALN